MKKYIVMQKNASNRLPNINNFQFTDLSIFSLSLRGCVFFFRFLFFSAYIPMRPTALLVFSLIALFSGKSSIDIVFFDFDHRAILTSLTSCLRIACMAQISFAGQFTSDYGDDGTPKVARFVICVNAATKRMQGTYSNVGTHKKIYLVIC